MGGCRGREGGACLWGECEEREGVWVWDREGMWVWGGCVGIGRVCGCSEGGGDREGVGGLGGVCRRWRG